MFVIRRATEEDIMRIAAIYDCILSDEEAGKTSIGWVRGIYPTADTARAALEAGELFVLEQDGILSAAAKINQEQVPEYAHAAWQEQDVPTDRIMVLHTLVVDPAFAGRGIGTAFVKFYEQYALKQGCRCLRMDTNIRNTTARRLYAQLGYREAGAVPCNFNGIPDVQLICLEKLL